MKKTLLISSLLVAFFVSNVNAQKNKKQELSEIHKKNIGKIVFSNSEIVYSKEDTSKFINTYNYGDSLFSRVYLEMSVLDFVTKQNKSWAQDSKTFSTTIFLDGHFISRNPFLTPEEFTDGEITNTTIFGNYLMPMPLKKAENKFYFANLFYDFIDEVSKTEQGEHTVKIEIHAYMGFGRELDPPIAKAELKINFPKSEGKVSLACLPPAEQNNPLLADRILKLYNTKQFYGKGEKVVFVTKEWRYFRNKFTSVIECRIADVVIATRNKDGKCYKLGYSFAEPFDGVKYQENGLYQYGEGGTKIDMPCDCLKK